MRRRVVVSLIAALFAAGPLYAQTGQITGSVTSSEGGRPLPGATVSVAGAQLRAVTGPDGRYTIGGVPAGTHTVSAAVIGHTAASRAVTVAAGQAATANFTLQASAVSLQGVVAIGYGERRVRDVTGAVQAVGEEQFNTGRVVSPEQLIQGKVAGVQVVSSGEPGGGASIRIRGGTSVNASNEPLIVVDGVPLQPGGGLSAGRNPLNFINPEDIARVTVLKDASSTAIYGSRGANGVIIIETKTGAATGPSFSYSNSFSTSRITREPSLLTADQFRAVVQAHAPDKVKYLGTASTDWRGAVERDAGGQEHSLSVAGAATNLNYRLSLNYLDQTGVVQGSETQRLSGAINYNHRLFNNRLNIRASVRGARTADDFTPGAVLGSASNFDPTQPIRTASGAWFEQTNFTLAPNNPVAELALVTDNGTTYRSVGNVEARYRAPFLDALSGTLRLGYDVAKSERESFYPSTLESQIENPVSCSTPPCPSGSVSRSNPTETTGLIDAFLTYARNATALFGGDVEATAGYSFERTDGSYPSFYARGLSSDLLGTHGVPTAVENVPSLFERTSKLASFFGRVNYTLADRYLLTLSVRRDGSSRFGPDNQWGTFPAVALGWRVNEESWFPAGGWLSELKLRGSWGVNGNQAIGDYLWAPAYTYSDAFARVQFGNEFVTTIRPSAVDPNIKWEETTSYNLGFDYGLWDGRISGAVEYYVKDTDDLLFRVPVAAGTNVSNYVTTNIGSMRNKGLEMTVNAQVLRGNGLTWNASLNAATNRNRLTSINPVVSTATRILVGGISGGVGSTIQVLQPGAPVNSFFVYRHKYVNGKPVATGSDLDMYEDLNKDGKITVDDRAPFHSPTPTWTIGHTSNFGYRNLDLGFTLRAYLGNYVYNNTSSSQGFYNQLLNAAGPVNLSSSVLTYNFENPQYFSDVYVEDASFLRMDNITLGYTLPSVRGLDQVRVFGTVQNVFTLTGYDGVDPEAGLNGIDNNIYPRSRTFSAGVSIGF